jgi:hydrogenase maturation protein HypF
LTLRKNTGINEIALSGGVFQNKYLTEKVVFLLEDKGFKVYIQRKAPPNDGGISLGQAVVAGYK